MDFKWISSFFTMAKINVKNSHIISLILLLILSGCAHEHPLNLTIAKEHVEKYHEGGQYDKELDKIAHHAIKHFKKISPENRATVIFDIDDTILSDYANLKSISFGYIPKLYHEWVLQANAPAIQQTKRLYDYLVEHKFHIIFLTGRKYDEYDATIKNLNNQGFTHFDKLIVRTKNEEKMTAQAYKTARRKQLTHEGYRIVGNVGDQWSDLNGGYSGHKVKIPNFRYLLS